MMKADKFRPAACLYESDLDARRSVRLRVKIQRRDCGRTSATGLTEANNLGEGGDLSRAGFRGGQCSRGSGGRSRAG